MDLGTGGPKVALVALDGTVLAHEFTPVETQMLPGGGATQDPTAWWQAIESSAARLVATGVVRPDQVVAVATTGQWGSTVPVDSSGNAVGPCLLWMDGRGHRYSRRVLRGPGGLNVEGYGPTKALRFIRKAAGAPTPQGKDPLGHILYLRHEEPAVYRATSAFLEPVDYLSLRFTGRAAATPASMILSWLVDIRDLAHARYASDLVRLSTRDPKRLPQLVPTGSVVGEVTPKVADSLGLPAGIPVVAGIPDLLSATMGSGAVSDFELHMAISTTSWLSCHVPFKKTDPFRQIATVPGLRPGRYSMANNHDTAGICLEWVRDVLFAEPAAPGSPGQGEGAAGKPSFAQLDQMAEAEAPGSGGLVFAPWLAGERCPVDDPRLRGSFLNLSLGTTRPQMVRAVLEGVALNDRWMQEAVAHFLKRPVTQVRFIGGGATSDLWCQIHADVMGVPVHQVTDPFLANVRGAGLFGAVAIGAIDMDEAARSVGVAKVFSPNPERRALYDEVYRHFAALYRQQRRMYHELNGSKSPLRRAAP